MTTQLCHINIGPKKKADVLKAMSDAFSDSVCTKCPGICCYECGPHNGYLGDFVSVDELAQLKHTYGWSSAGFKGETGCLLPLDLRSPTCLAFFCGQKRNGFMPDGVPAELNADPADVARTVERVIVFQARFEAALNLTYSE